MGIKVIVIGAGPGGYAAALYCAHLGNQVTLIEQEYIGGTCLNIGCIPTKVFVQAANVYSSAVQAAVYGIQTGDVQVDFSKTAKFKNRVIKQLTGGVGYLLKKANVQVITGKARLINGTTVEVTAEEDTTQHTAEAIILACGSSEIKLPQLPVDGFAVLNSTQILDLQRLPESLVIVGGGVIGVEFASILARFGKKVSIVEMMPTILPQEDQDIVEALTQALQKQGVDIYTETAANKIIQADGNSVTLELINNGKSQTLVAERVLVCVGRRANLQDIGLDSAGVAHNGRYIETDGYMRTSLPTVYAVGDLTGSAQLAHVAYYEAKIAARHISGVATEEAGYYAAPSCIFSHPEVARVGMTEAQARKQYQNIEVKLSLFHGNGKALVEQEAEGFVKAVYDAEKRTLLGMSIIGPKATELITEPGLAITKRLPIDVIADTIHAHPTLSEMLNEVAAAAENMNLHS